MPMHNDFSAILLMFSWNISTYCLTTQQRPTFMQQRTVNCPQCGKRVIWEAASRFRPFCSERCKTNDLSKWAQESYRIPEPEQNPEDNQTNESTNG